MGERVVLMYHGIEFPAIYGSLVYTVKREEFINQLDLIKEIGLEVKLLDSEIKDRDIVISFDDGEESVYRVAFPLMEERGFKGELYITTDWIGKEQYLRREMIKELKENGWSIGSHGKSHRFLRVLPEKEIEKELKDSKSFLEDIIGEEVKKLSLPGGRGDKRVIELAKTIGYEYILNSIPGINIEPLNKESIKRVAIKRGLPSAYFLLIINFCRPFFYTLDLYYNLKEGLKRVLGDERYHSVIKFLYKYRE